MNLRRIGRRPVYIALAAGLTAAVAASPADAAAPPAGSANYVNLYITRTDDFVFNDINVFFVAIEIVLPNEVGVTGVTVAIGDGAELFLTEDFPGRWFEEIDFSDVAAMNQAIGGLWTITISGDSPSTSTFSFNAAPLQDSDFFATATGIVPPHGSVDVPPDVVFFWKDPTGKQTADALIVFVGGGSEMGQTDNSINGTLDITDTSWDPPIDLESGDNEFSVLYLNFDDAALVSQLTVTGGSIIWGDSPLAPKGYPAATPLLLLGSQTIVLIEVIGSVCPWDLDSNGSVGAADLLSLLVSWGPCKGCPADFDGNGNVGASDLLALLVNWGPCPPPPLMPFPISVEPPPADQLSIGVAFDGTNFLVGIQGDNLYGKGGSSQITAQLVSQTGTLVGLLIEVDRTGGVPSVAFDGTNYLLVWADDLNFPDNELYGQFIGSSGALIGTPFLIAATVQEDEPANLISIAFGETSYLVTYYRELNPKMADSKLYGRIVGTDGSVGEELSISTGLADHAAPNVAWDGTNYLVIWTDDGNDAVVIGRFVSPTGSLGLEFTINASPDPSDNPATVAFDGTNYLVAWSDEVGGQGSGQWDVLGQLVSPAGNLVGGIIPISIVPGRQILPFIAFDGASYLVTWTDFRNDANHDIVCDVGEGTCADIYGQYISSSGALAGSEFAISTEPDNQVVSPVVFANGKYLVVYNTSPDFETGLGVFGVFIAP